MTAEPTDPTERPAPKRTSSKKVAATEQRLHQHLRRLADPDLSKEAHRLLHMLRVEAAHWRHRFRDATADDRSGLARAREAHGDAELSPPDGQAPGLPTRGYAALTGELVSLVAMARDEGWHEDDPAWRQVDALLAALEVVK